MMQDTTTAKRGMAYAGRPGDMQELFTHWRQVGFKRAFSEFLDEFYTCPAQEALDAEPPAGIEPEFRAFLAATVETLALDWGYTVPVWTQAPSAVLATPICWEIWRAPSTYHPEDRERIARIVEKEAPTIFRQHGILVRANVISRV